MADEVTDMRDMIALVRRYVAEADRVDRLGCALDPGYLMAWVPVTQMWIQPKNGHPRVHYSAATADLAAEKLADLYERHLYKASLYVHPEHGPTTAVVVSANEKSWGPPGYRERLFVAAVDGTLKLVGKESGCTQCWCTGVEKEGSPRAGQSCGVCAGVGWSPVKGVNVAELTGPSEVVRLAEPDDPRYLAAHALDV